MRKPERSRPALVRWYILRVIEDSRPVGVSEALLCDILDAADFWVTALDVRRDLHYLELAALVKIDRPTADKWIAHLTGSGVNFVSYDAPDIDGIDRPERALGER